VRIQLKSGLPMVRRGPSTVQIGVDARYGTIVDGLTGADLALLDELAGGIDDDALDLPGTARARSLVRLLGETGVLQRTRRTGPAGWRPQALRARLAPDAGAWSILQAGASDGWGFVAPRRRAVVELQGEGRTAFLLAAALAAAGVGTVRGAGTRLTVPGDVAPGGAAPDDVGTPFAAAVDRVARRAAGTPAARQEVVVARPGPADVVVLVDRAAADPTRGDRLLAADVPHLSVVVRETSIVVGPFVRPGNGPCLRCLDLHRTDRDPQWPLVLAQLLRRPAERRLPYEETALAHVAAGIAALQVLAHLDGRDAPAAAGATLEIELPHGLAGRRPWPAHPSCGCTWPPAGPPSRDPSTDPSTQPRSTGPGAPARASPGQDGREGPRAETMLR